MINVSEEYCPFCDDYFNVDANKCEQCPGGCGNDLVPCNACLCGEDGCYCDWVEGKQGCRRFPKENEAGE